MEYIKKLVFVCMVSVFVCVSLSARAEKYIVIDTRLLVLVHPLFRVFDSETGRFKGTSSEPIWGGQDGIDEAIAEIKELQDWLLKSPRALQKKLRNIPLTDRIEAEREFLREKRIAENKLNTMKMRVYMARMIPNQPGMTPPHRSMYR